MPEKMAPPVSQYDDDGIDLEPSPLSAEEVAKMEEEQRQELIAVMWEYCEDGYGPPGWGTRFSRSDVAGLDRYEDLESW